MLVAIIIVLAILCFLLIFSLRVLIEFIEFRKKINKFDGLKGYPVVGNVDIVLFGDKKTLYLKGRDLARQFLSSSRIGAGWLLHKAFVFLLCPEEIETLLSSTVNISKGDVYSTIKPWLGTGLLTSTGKKWQQRRKMLTPAFHFNILKKFLFTFKTESKHLVEVLKKHTNEDFDIVPVITKFTLDTICETAMGTPLSSLAGPKYYKSIHDIGTICISRVAKPWLLSDLLYFFTRNYWRQCKIIEYLHRFSFDVIEKRKRNFEKTATEINDDSDNYSQRKQYAMLDILLSVQREEGSIDDEGIREEVDTFMFEGHDTTSLALVYTLMLLANNRLHQDKIYQEIKNVFDSDDEEPTYSKLQLLKYMEMCIKESLRLYPSVPLIARELDADVETVSGNNVPANCTCLVSIFDIHRKPEIYPNPEVFDPDRFLPDNIAKRHPFAYIPFSAGPRNCIGQKFAMMELKCVLTEILRNFILEPVDTPKTIEHLLDLVLRPAGPIKVRFLSRNNEVNTL